MEKEEKKAAVLSRKDFDGKEFAELDKVVEADIVLFQEELAGIDDVGILKTKEAELMEMFKANDKYLESVEYEMPAEIEYDGEKVKRSDIANNIAYFLNKLEVEFRATLGVWQAIRYWKTKAADNVPYAVYDSTLRMLGTLKFKGEKEFYDILAINNWFAEAHNSYIRDNAYTKYLSARHQAIMSRMEELEKGDEPEMVNEDAE